MKIIRKITNSPLRPKFLMSRKGSTNQGFRCETLFESLPLPPDSEAQVAKTKTRLYWPQTCNKNLRFTFSQYVMDTG